ncbi:MAG: hypothetical protein OXC40_05955 [Proteobacteria bacterium]|nr:hypothetical protein [Pseudomonadota bacterium]
MAQESDQSVTQDQEEAVNVQGTTGSYSGIEDIINDVRTTLSRDLPQFTILGMGDRNLAIASQLSFDAAHRKNDLASEALTGATAFGSGYLKRGSIDGYVGLYLNTFADISLTPRDSFSLDLEQAYFGLLIAKSKTKIGFIRSSIYQSELWRYERALPSISLALNFGKYQGEILYSFLPYEKKDRPTISENFPYTVTLALRRDLDGPSSQFLRSISLMLTAVEDVPSELAEQYFVKGNTVTRGRYSSALDYQMLTGGISWKLDGELTTRDRLTSSWEVLRNFMVPEKDGKSYGLWADLIYHRQLNNPVPTSCYFGYKGYSIGADAILAEFSNRNLEFTGTNGHGPSAGCAYGSLKVEGNLWFIEPRRVSIYKRKTRTVVFSITNKLF